MSKKVIEAELRITGTSNTGRAFDQLVKDAKRGADALKQAADYDAILARIKPVTTALGGVAKASTAASTQIAADTARIAKEYGHLKGALDLSEPLKRSLSQMRLSQGQIGQLLKDAGRMQREREAALSGIGKGPKTAAGVRDVPLPAHIADLLREWLARHFVANEADLVFTSPTGIRMHGSSVSSALWHPILERAGLLRKSDNFHFHSLRHFAASWWIHNGMPLTDASSLLGHSKFDLTLQIYAHPVVGGNRRQEAFQRMTAGLLAGQAGDTGSQMPFRCA